MATDLFTFVDLYRRQLDTAAHLLDKGAEFAAANGVDEREMLGWRLIDDMHPLGFQVMVIVNFAQRWVARAADLPLPDEIGPDLDVAGFKAAIGTAKAFLDTVEPAQLRDRDDAPLTLEIRPGMAPTMPAGHWLTGFATTNLYFHLSTAYAILRSKGVPIGKADLFAGGL